jgi:hypothetical protein
MKLEKRTIEEWVYTDSAGRERKLDELNSKHLLNAYTKSVLAFHEGSPYDKDNEQLMSILKEEVLRRMPIG